MREDHAYIWAFPAVAAVEGIQKIRIGQLVALSARRSRSTAPTWRDDVPHVERVSVSRPMGESPRRPTTLTTREARRRRRVVPPPAAPATLPSGSWRGVRSSEKVAGCLPASYSLPSDGYLSSGLSGGSTSQLHPQDLPTDIMHDQTGSDVAMDANEQDVDLVPNNRDRAPRRGRRVTINKDLRKKRAKGKQIEISFPPQFKKVCGKHARLFKSEISVIVRSIPLKVKKWKELDDLHPAATADAWRKLKGKFPELSDQDKECAMKQVESQYNNRRYRLLQVYKQNKPRPAVVSPEDWQWLIRNLWTDADFKKRSDQNSLNRGKQEMGSKVGTKSIIQIAYELRDPETGEWPTAMQVWRATYQKADGTWSIPSGEETMTRLQEAAETHQERISAAPVPLVEHFALVLGRKPNHSRGVGIHAVNRVAEERIRLQAEIEAAEQRAADAQARAEAADQRAEAAEQRAQVMEGQLATMVESNAQMQEEQQSQRVELNSIRDTQNGEVARLVKQQLDQHMALFFERMRSGAPISFSQPLADNQGRLNGDE
ncbi:hypothetical protein ACP70R_029043 [Stipagrostis hirtigluma subsp. patula]